MGLPAVDACVWSSSQLCWPQRTHLQCPTGRLRLSPSRLASVWLSPEPMRGMAKQRCWPPRCGLTIRTPGVASSAVRFSWSITMTRVIRRFFPFGPNADITFAQGFFDVAMEMNPKPKTVTISVADSEFPQTAAIGARHWAKKYDLNVVYDRSFPPNQLDFAPIIRAIQAT